MIRSNVETVPPEFTEFALPSGGLPYRVKFPDFPVIARVGSFTFKDEAILTTNMGLLDKMSWITKSVFQNLPAGFDIDDLIDEDQMVIMALARGQTYGESYAFSTLCGNCGHREAHEMKIPDQLPVRNWKFKTLEELEAHLTTQLPKTKDVVRLRNMTVGITKRRAKEDEAETNPDTAAPEAADQPRKTPGKSVIVKKVDPAASAKVVLAELPKEAVNWLTGFAWRIESVNGTTPDSVQEAAEYLLKLSGPDRIALQGHRDKSACGIDYDIPIRCDKCKNQFTAFLPIGSSFFRRGQ